ncbi:hypothetical protein [Tychonema sp. BBK16]|uniref:hypothetical protein n=1 Tax=Tychonema sp. BBK16 TaxID=2699888 RepID=UPI001F1C4F15|nr:hypothetical protein [Tychonema sp. BBK16]MCF6372964.1 hypothetical protein [Tychonema sp. BBK16]
MTIHRIEYLILSSVIQHHENLRNLASDWRLSHTEVVVAADRLFQKGYIKARFRTEDEKFIEDITLNRSQIQTHLDGKFNTFYYLTPEGGACWESLAHPNWNNYQQWYLGSETKETGLFESRITCCSRQIIEKTINLSQYLQSQTILLETCVWEEIECWKVMYWKTLPKACKVTYQYRHFEWSISPNTPQEWIDKDRQANQWYSKILHWYTKPELDTNPSNLFGDAQLNFYARFAETANPKVEYLILKFAVINKDELRSVAYSENLSHAETAFAADSLFQRGDIKARVFADEDDTEGTSDVVLTRAGIQDHLDGRLLACYYLTPQGGARWEAMAHPDWSKFFSLKFYEPFPYEEQILGTQQQIMEQLLVLERFIFDRQHIQGKEVWDVLEPWQATYWKTLPRGYQVRCESQPNVSDNSELDYLKEGAPPELVEEYEQAMQCYEDMKKWYTDPSFD